MSFDNLDLLVEDTLVAGVQHNAANCKAFYDAAKSAHEAGFLADDISIQLKREPENPYDSYAVKVIGKWIIEDDRKKSVPLGYLNKDMAWRVGQATEPEDRIYGEFVSIEPHAEFGFDIRINVFVKYGF